MLSEVVEEALPYIVLFNFAFACVVLVVVLSWAGHRKMREIPTGVQNVAEYALDWFVKQSRGIDSTAIGLIVPFLATLFMVILASNLMAIVPFPLLNIPPTAFFGVTFTLALIAVVGNTVLSAIHRGVLKAAKHLVWPNPIQLISEVSDVASLSLRLFGNIAGEFLVVLLVMESAPYGIPLIIHGLGLIPAFVQPLVFTLLTASFLANSMRHVETKARAAGKPAKAKKKRFRLSFGGSKG